MGPKIQGPKNKGPQNLEVPKCGPPKNNAIQKSLSIFSARNGPSIDTTSISPTKTFEHRFGARLMARSGRPGTIHNAISTEKLRP